MKSPLPRPGSPWRAIKVDADYCKKNVGDLAKNAELSRFSFCRICS